MDDASPSSTPVEGEAFPPPERLSRRAAEAWREVTAAHGQHAGRVIGPDLEVYCEAVGRAREAHERIAVEGMIVADPRGSPIPHPALSVAKAAEATIERLGARFQPRVSRQGGGYMTRATRTSVHAAGLDEHEEYRGAVAGALTLALVIDNAQEEGRDALRRAAFGPIPTYLKAVKDLGLMPTLAAVDGGGADEADGAEAAPISLDAWRESQGE